MEQVKVLIDTDWWMFIAGLSSGVLAALATLIAVILTNRETRKQLRQQQTQHDKEVVERNREAKFVIIKPTIMLSSLMGVLDRIIIQNNYNRELLLSGEDGFDFFDDVEKRCKQTCRILHIDNTSSCDITDVILLTESYLEDRDTNEIKRYETKNLIKLLRAKESIDIRLTNQEQFESLIRMNKDKKPSELKFMSTVEYTTGAGQRIHYCFNVKISNDKCIEIENDEIEKVEDCSETIVNQATAFRNLQDYITIDRAAYIWEKMGQSQARGLLALVSPWSIQQENIITESEEKMETGKMKE